MRRIVMRDGIALEVGSHVFCPPHGVGSVLARERRDFGASTAEFYVIGLSRGGKLLQPVSTIDQAGIRPLISTSKARELVDMLEVPPEPARTATPRERAAAYAEGLKSGVPERYTAILRELLFRSRNAKLSPGDHHVLEVARAYFVGEIGAVLKRSPAEMAASLDGSRETASK
jgi:RNA polymerase-interacting CarD/CdnL/TRCF family regulator